MGDKSLFDLEKAQTYILQLEKELAFAKQVIYRLDQRVFDLTKGCSDLPETRFKSGDRVRQGDGKKGTVKGYYHSGFVVYVVDGQDDESMTFECNLVALKTVNVRIVMGPNGAGDMWQEGHRFFSKPIELDERPVANEIIELEIIDESRNRIHVDVK